eukprot:scaffold6153_cov71-Skeletonema_dohrnii-CCMP3373.AAC.1
MEWVDLRELVGSTEYRMGHSTGTDGVLHFEALKLKAAGALAPNNQKKTQNAAANLASQLVSFCAFMMMAADGWYIYNGTGFILVSAFMNPSLSFRQRHFMENQKLEEVDCHDRVKEVKEHAFSNCPSLRKVIMPGVEVVEGWAFTNCKALADFECGKLERIRHHAFDGCESLRSINLPSAKVVEGCTFMDCKALKEVKFGKELESIRRGAFLYCRSLEQITIPLKDGMFTYDSIFQGCKKLKHVDLVEGVVLRDTIAALLLEEWKNEMKEKIDSINQILPTTPAGGFDDAGGKAQAVRMWIRSVLDNIVRYKAQHHSLLNEAATALQLDLPNDIVNKNILPFLELPSYTFEGED